MNKDTHPIDLFIVVMLDMINGLCWIINELAGFHVANAKDTTPVVQPGILNGILSAHIEDYVMSLTVKQLRAYTGRTNSRLSKADLQAIALA